MEIRVVCAVIRQSMYQPWVAVEVEDNRFVVSEQAIKIRVRQSMGMLSRCLQPQQIYHIDKANLEVWKLFPQHRVGSQSLLRGNVTGASQDDIRLLTLVSARPRPDSDTFRAVFYSGTQIQVLYVFLLIRDDHIYVVHASQAVIGAGK